jgi:DNA invertase Pin-like site-specific DNA recombinase
VAPSPSEPLDRHGRRSSVGRRTKGEAWRSHVRVQPRIEVSWIARADALVSQREQARALAGLLAEVPVRRAGAPVVLKTSAGVVRQHPLGEPISYRAVGTYLPELPAIKAAPPRVGQPAPRERRVRVLRSNDMDGDAHAPRVRPGTGGRNPAPHVLTQTTATRELIELIGPPIEVRAIGAMRVHIYLYDETGDGIIDARLSGRDIQNGETALGQVHPALEGAKRLGLLPRYIVVATDVSGGNFLKDRPDLLFLQDEILNSRCRWVWFRQVDRIARRPQVFYTFAELLESADVQLYLTDIPGRPVDWENDEIHLGFDSLMGSRERREIYNRTHGALVRRWLNEGRGWPGALRFGFRRSHETKYPEIDPEQWKYVRMIFELYAQYEDGEGSGVRAVQAALEKAGCNLAISTIQRVLKNEVYFTGEWTTQRAGQVVENKPIEIPEDQRISPELYERVQNLRKLRRGKDMRTPPGTFALNRIGHFIDGTRIRARVTKPDADEVIYYRPYSVKKGDKIPKRWHGWKIEADLLEDAIFDELLRLANCLELQEEWTKIAHPDFGGSTPILSEEARVDLTRRIRNLDTAIAKLDRQMATRVADGGVGDTDLFAERRKIVGPLEADKKGMEEQLRRAEAIESMRKTTKPKADASLLDALRQVLTSDDDDEPEVVLKRTVFLEKALSSVVLDIGDDGRVIAQLHGPLVPADLPVLTVHDPVTVLHDELESEVRRGPTADQPSPKSSLKTRLVGGIAVPTLGARNPTPLRRTPGSSDEVLVSAWSSPMIDLDVVAEHHAAGHRAHVFYDSKVVERICELRAEGWSLERIATRLNDDGAPTPRGGEWSAALLSPLLQKLRKRADLPPDIVKALAVVRVPRSRVA